MMIQSVNVFDDKVLSIHVVVSRKGKWLVIVDNVDGIALHHIEI